MRKRGRRKQGAKTKEKILEVATKLFAERGFPNVSIRDICDAAGVSLPLVYYYYQNKNRLFEEVVARQVRMEPFYEALENAVAKKRTVWEKFKAFLHTYVTKYPEEVVTIGFYLREMAQIDEKGKKSLMKSAVKIRQILEKILGEGVRKKEMRSVEVTSTAWAILGSMNGFLLRWIHFQEPFDRKKTADFLFEFFRKGLKAGR